LVVLTLSYADDEHGNVYRMFVLLLCCNRNASVQVSVRNSPLSYYYFYSTKPARREFTADWHKGGAGHATAMLRADSLLEGAVGVNNFFALQLRPSVGRLAGENNVLQTVCDTAAQRRKIAKRKAHQQQQQPTSETIINSIGAIIIERLS
jgi:hypothetical protein